MTQRYAITNLEFPPIEVLTFLPGFCWFVLFHKYCTRDEDNLTMSTNDQSQPTVTQPKTSLHCWVYSCYQRKVLQYCVFSLDGKASAITATAWRSSSQIRPLGTPASQHELTRAPMTGTKRPLHFKDLTKSTWYFACKKHDNRHAVTNSIKNKTVTKCYA